MNENSNNNETATISNTVLPAVKLTKKVLNDFIGWTTSRYNDYLGFGTKREAVLTAYHSLLKGYCVNAYVYKRGQRKGEIELREKSDIKIVKLECAGAVGERPTNSTGSSHYWKTKQGGDEYIVDCVEKTIAAKYSKRTIKFDLSI